ncbi:putative inactive leucine-rich repeat receptor-like protein kinase [Apostasia shenzhenica]|uniref:Putative inactive leucine-rich repeat receptor-like protein kinase n=1 Tax=Apostasia shenzhenica TaxID=1088818 RepID=A0A2I0AXV2_9ASPA|nr:putative inactive leucine-rich repeat receptor-like protein kinase [Apostasia shenzhenica]
MNKITEGKRRMVKVEEGFAFCASSLLLLLLFLAAPSATALTTDGLSLLALKAAVSVDPSRALAAWLDTDREPCGWPGVVCRGDRVTAVSLANLSLVGYLPSELSLLSSLETLSLPHNSFSGPIPAAVGEIRSLISIDLSDNNFSGFVPAEIGALDSLVHLDLSANHFNGSLPPEIAGLPLLSGVLNLSCNLFTGRIPQAYGNIPVDVSLDLRQNKLTGEIPQVGSLLNQGPTAFAGNPGLCGFPLKNSCNEADRGSRLPVPSLDFNPGAPSAHPAGRGRQRRPAVPIPILAGIIVAAFGSIIVLQWQLRRRRGASNEKLGGKGKQGLDSPARNGRRECQQGEEVFVALDESFGLELEELLRASAYVIGKSRSGIVYKVVASHGFAVAVRRLSELEDGQDVNSSSDEFRRRRAFESETMAIGRANHPNVVRLRAYYYAPDEKLLIYDYIPNGNLHTAVHGRQGRQPCSAAVIDGAPSPPLLCWGARLAILQGVARGLAYLHEISPRKCFHGSVKSSKILLDDELRPYVSGFGISRLQRNSSGTKKQQPPAAATGYLAPELRDAAAAAAATQRGDVYAFGVLMMETTTGKSPDAELVEWVRRAFKEELPLSEVVDPVLLKEVHAKREVLAVFHIALWCTEIDQDARPRMRAVAESLDRVASPS